MRYEPIGKNFFAANRKKLSKKLKPGSIAVFFANYQMPRNGDQYHPYRQNSDFFYLTGIEQEKSILLIAPDAPKETKEVLFILRSNKLLEVWEGHKLTPDEASAVSGIATIKLTDDFESVFHSLTGNAEYIYMNVPELPKFNPEVASRDADMANKIKNKYPLHRFERSALVMQELRLIKSETEIALIKKAIHITGIAFERVL
ncbi:MAG: aminopeptidase P N-terminal domain-containing protein, partial [Bacteroidales bacterium]